MKEKLSETQKKHHKTEELKLLKKLFHQVRQNSKNT